MQLITPYEVLVYSTAGQSYPTDSFCQLIPQIEQEFSRECLGDDLYEYLISKLTPYPATTTDWDSSITYAIGAVVIRNGCTYTSTANSNTTDPLDAGSSWAAFVKFTDAGCNSLWEKYLRFILALKVYSASIVFTTVRSGAGGLAVSNGDSSGFRSASKNEMVQVAAQLQGNVERATSNMLLWLSDNAVTLGLPQSNCTQGCETVQRRSRRFSFRV